MSEERISQLADELESLAAGEKAQLRSAEHSPPGWIFVSGNRAALLRLAACCLRASLGTIGPDHSARPVQLDDAIDQGIMPEKHDRRIGFIERVESFPDYEAVLQDRRRRSKAVDRWILVGCALFIFFFIFGVFAFLAVLFGLMQS